MLYGFGKAPGGLSILAALEKAAPLLFMFIADPKLPDDGLKFVPAWKV